MNPSPKNRTSPGLNRFIVRGLKIAGEPSPTCLADRMMAAVNCQIRSCWTVPKGSLRGGSLRC